MTKFKPQGQGGEVMEQQGRSNPLEGRTRTFFCSPGENRVIVPLDDELVPVRRHRLWLPNPPTTAIYGYRLTCACWDPREYTGLEALTCRACNAVAAGHTDPGVSHPTVIWHATVIAEGELMRKDKQSGQMLGTGIFDYRYLLELDDKGQQMWKVKKDTYGGLKGMRINVFRSLPPRGQKAKTPRYGESWDVLPGGPVDLRLHFWRSPAIPRLIEFSARSTTGVVTHEQAVNNLITPINYDEEFDNYSEEAANRMVAVACGQAVELSAPIAPTGGGYAPPPMPGGGRPAPTGVPAGYAPVPVQQPQVDYSTQTMSTGQVPAYAPPQPAPTPTAPTAAPQVAYTPPPPPMVPDPTQAPTQTAYTPPPAAYAPPPMPQPAAPAPAAPAPGAPPAGGSYAFDRGWTPGFPQPQAQPQYQAPAQPAQPQPVAAQPAAPQYQAAPAAPQYQPPPLPPAASPAGAPPVPHYDKPPF